MKKAILGRAIKVETYGNGLALVNSETGRVLFILREEEARIDIDPSGAIRANVSFICYEPDQ